MQDTEHTLGGILSKALKGNTMNAAATLASMVGNDISFIRQALCEAAINNPQAFVAAFGPKAGGAYDTEWQNHARNGRKIDAIKEYRQQYSGTAKYHFGTCGLKEAKDAVEQWMWSKGYN